MRLGVIYGDITELHVDCIVNAAKPSLLGGGGVDGAIHRKAGIELKEYCKSLSGCKLGEAKLSPAFKLPSKFIIHTVGPRYLFKTQNEECQLANCYNNTLVIANEHKFNEVVFSNISTGAYGYPKKLAAEISLLTIVKYLEDNIYPLKVIICCYDLENLEIYRNLLKNYKNV